MLLSSTRDVASAAETNLVSQLVQALAIGNGKVTAYGVSSAGRAADDLVQKERDREELARLRLMLVAHQH